jgi:hypothetical protein
MLKLTYSPPSLTADIANAPAGRRTIDMVRKEILSARAKVIMTYVFCAVLVLTSEMLLPAPPDALIRPLAAIPVFLFLLTTVRFDAGLQRTLAGLEHASPSQETVATTLANGSALVARYMHALHMQGRPMLIVEFRAIERHIESLPQIAPVELTT